MRKTVGKHLAHLICQTLYIISMNLHSNLIVSILSLFYNEGNVIPKMLNNLLQVGPDLNHLQGPIHNHPQ